MQTQSRLSVSGLGSADEHEAVVRELTCGHELTARLQEEAMRALQGKGQAEATAAFILGEMSRAFTLSISIMSGSGPAPPAPGTPRPCVSVAAGAGARRAKDDGVPRKRKMTSSPHSDGYQWRKYGQKKIMRTNFPRCYYKCSNHRGRNCPATKQVQQEHSNGDRPLYLVIYVNEHTCHKPLADQPDAGATTPLVGFSRLSRQGGAHAGAAHGVVALDHHGAKEERERQALVSSLTCVLQQGQHSSAGGAGASAATADASELPVRLAGGDEELDVTDYDVITDTVYFGASTDELDDGMLF